MTGPDPSTIRSDSVDRPGHGSTLRNPGSGTIANRFHERFSDNGQLESSHVGRVKTSARTDLLLPMRIKCTRQQGLAVAPSH